MNFDLGRALSEAAAAEQAEAEAARAEAFSLHDYIELVRSHPEIADDAPQRLYRMIDAAGYEDAIVPGEISYKFFNHALFGIDRSLQRFVSYLKGAAAGHELRNRIVLLWGPPGGAKSTALTTIKRGYEAYSHTDEGALYAIEGCPQHEEPLHLIPQRLRDQVAEHIGRPIPDGRLCPVCEHRLEHEFGGDFTKFQVRRIFCSEARRVGIATFEPSDPKSMSIEQLTGGMDLRKIKEFGSDAHPMALDWAGEFTKANRGIFEAIEFLKNPREFLFAFLSLAQERQFKVPKFGHVSSDTVLIAHCNEADYRKVIEDQSSEALRDRLFTIAVPYNVTLREEVRIYEKLLAEAQAKQGFHVAPHTLITAAEVAILSRLKEAPEKLELMEKLHLYNGEETGEWKLAQVDEIKRKSDGEGMQGLGPRPLINALASAATEQAQQDASDAPPCLNPIDALIALRAHIQTLDLGSERTDRLVKFIGQAREELDRELKNEVQKAFIPAFEEKAQELVENYLNNVEAVLDDTKLIDPVTGEERDPDKTLMRGIEEMVGVSENEADEFRQGVMVRIAKAARAGRPLSYRTDDRLGKAIERRLFEEMSGIVRVTTSKVNPDHEHEKRKNVVVDEMIAERGYCPRCANAVLEYVGDLLNR